LLAERHGTFVTTKSRTWVDLGWPQMTPVWPRVVWSVDGVWQWHMFILTRIDYCNALYAELPDSTLAPLRVLHAAVRFVVGLRARDHVTGALIKLHWLPVRYSITYKLCTLMHGVVYGHAPQYLSEMMVRVSQLAGRSHLRSAHKGAYDTPRIRTTFGSRSFSFAAPYARNQLPADVCAISTVSTFKQHLKTHLFNIAYLY